MRKLLLLLIAVAFSYEALSSEQDLNVNVIDHFQDQEQYERFFDYKFQSNIVEFMILECTGERGVSWKLGFVNAEITNSYHSDILGLDIFDDPFSELSPLRNVWIEAQLIASRNPDVQGGEGDPIHDAHREVLRIFREFEKDRDILCDFVFWDEVSKFQIAVGDLIEDTKKRYVGKESLIVFEKRISESIQILNRFFAANPLP